jgi:hypothetical protein
MGLAPRPDGERNCKEAGRHRYSAGKPKSARRRTLPRAATDGAEAIDHRDERCLGVGNPRRFDVQALRLASALPLNIDHLAPSSR